MRVLVTGCAGFIGSHTAAALLTEGHDVVGVDCFTDYYDREVKQSNLRSISAPERFTFWDRDLRTDPLHDLLTGCDAVLHLAAMPGLPRSWQDVETYAACNLLATARLAQACLDVGVPKVVHASTSSVYGRDAVGDETMPTRPVSPYGVTKLAAEHLLMAFTEERALPVVILRYFSIYGPRQRPDMAYHIFAETLLDDGTVVVHGNGSQSRSSTYVGDCVRGTVQAMHSAPTGEVFNIGGGEVITLLDALDLIAGLSGVAPKVAFADRRHGDQGQTAADTGKARRAFGFAALTSPVEGLRLQVEWHQERRSTTRAAVVPVPREEALSIDLRDAAEVSRHEVALEEGHAS